MDYLDSEFSLFSKYYLKQNNYGLKKFDAFLIQNLNTPIGRTEYRDETPPLSIFDVKSGKKVAIFTVGQKNAVNVTQIKDDYKARKGEIVTAAKYFASKSAQKHVKGPLFLKNKIEKQRNNHL